MIRNKLYDELEKEGYSFIRLRLGPGQTIPKVESLSDPDDWALVNTTITINGQYKVEYGLAATEKTAQVLQKVVEEISKPDYYDYISKSLVESTSM